jgi:alpha-N-arabinofuranosidase
MPVKWEDGWPIVSPGTGRIEFEYPCPRLEENSETPESPSPRDDFNSAALSFIWNTLRTPRERFWSLEERPGYMKLSLRNKKLSERVNPSFIGRRQQHIRFSALAAMEIKPCEDGDAAGLALVQSNEYHYRFEYTRQSGKNWMRLVRCFKGEETELIHKEFYSDRVIMKVSAYGQDYCFYYGASEKELEILAENVDGRMLSTDVAGGFVGTYIGMFAYCEKETGLTADFDWFTYNRE